MGMCLCLYRLYHIQRHAQEVVGGWGGGYDGVVIRTLRTRHPHAANHAFEILVSCMQVHW